VPARSPDRRRRPLRPARGCPAVQPRDRDEDAPRRLAALVTPGAGVDAAGRVVVATNPERQGGLRPSSAARVGPVPLRRLERALTMPAQRAGRLRAAAGDSGRGAGSSPRLSDRAATDVSRSHRGTTTMASRTVWATCTSVSRLLRRWRDSATFGSTTVASTSTFTSSERRWPDGAVAGGQVRPASRLVEGARASPPAVRARRCPTAVARARHLHHNPHADSFRQASVAGDRGRP
jgi:hypothetical protein